jgi:hypothetical protein
MNYAPIAMRSTATSCGTMWIKVQEDFKELGGDTLDKLDVYIAHCDAVVRRALSSPAEAPR